MQFRKFLGQQVAWMKCSGILPESFRHPALPKIVTVAKKKAKISRH
jgi:hypothetical protein